MKMESPIGTTNIGGFYYAVVFDSDGIPPDELLGENNVDRLISATERVYGHYMARAISPNMRQPLVTDGNVNASVQRAFPANLIQQSDHRIKQNAVPKLILQILLGFMFVCGVASWIVLDTRHLLYHNPCSIAGVASLLAGSKMLENDDVLPPGAQWMSDKEMKRLGVFDGWFFSLG